MLWPACVACVKCWCSLQRLTRGTHAAVKVLATARFPAEGVTGPHDPNGPVEMPTIWTKMYGQGRVFYDAIGHQANVVETEPNLTIMRRGFNWAAREKRDAERGIAN